MTTVHRCKENGAEAWRQLQVQYNPRTLGNKVTIRNRIMNPKTCVADGKLVETIEEWEENIAKLYEMFNEAITDSEKISFFYQQCATPKQQKSFTDSWRQKITKWSSRK